MWRVMNSLEYDGYLIIARYTHETVAGAITSRGYPRILATLNAIRTCTKRVYIKYSAIINNPNSAESLSYTEEGIKEATDTVRECVEYISRIDQWIRRYKSVEE